VAALQELDTAQIPPTSSVLPPRSRLRADEVRRGLDTEAALRNAPVSNKIIPRSAGFRYLGGRQWSTKILTRSTVSRWDARRKFLLAASLLPIIWIASMHSMGRCMPSCPGSRGRPGAG
jgi:hypothetical protein